MTPGADEVINPKKRGLKLSVEQKVVVGFTFVLFMMSAIGAVSYLNVVKLRDNAAQVVRTQEIITHLGLVLSAITDAETGTRGYTITGDESFLDPYHKALQSIDNELSRLRQLIADPAQQERLAALVPMVAGRLVISRKVVELRRNEGFEAAQRQTLLGEGQRLHDQIRRLFAEMIGAEESLLQERELRTRHSVLLLQRIIIGGGVFAFAICGLSLFFVRRDITARKQAEDQLDRFFALSLDMLCIAGADGYFKRVNPAFTQTLGWSTEEFLARPFLDFVHPDDRAATLREVEKQIAAGEHVLNFENRYQHKDGSWHVLSWASVPSAGELMFATGRDVTEHKAAAEQLRDNAARINTILDTVVDGILTINERGIVETINPAAERIFGYTAAEVI